MVTIPYTKSVSEKIARAYKRFGIDTVHKPSVKLKDKLVKAKDPIHQLDKVNAIYDITSKKNPADSYIGETERPFKARGYEHKVISHEDKIKYHSINNNIHSETPPSPPPQPVPLNTTRRSKRIAEKPKVDYAKMNEGEKIITNAGSSEVAKYMMDRGLQKEDMEIRFRGYERNWMKRGIKEAIEIRRRKPTINADQGRYYLPSIWDVNIRTPNTSNEKKDIRSRAEKFDVKPTVITDEG